MKLADPRLIRKEPGRIGQCSVKGNVRLFAAAVAVGTPGARPFGQFLKLFVAQFLTHGGHQLCFVLLLCVERVVVKHRYSHLS
jgi:hypothetical protein